MAMSSRVSRGILAGNRHITSLLRFSRTPSAMIMGVRRGVFPSRTSTPRLSLLVLGLVGCFTTCRTGTATTEFLSSNNTTAGEQVATPGKDERMEEALSVFFGQQVR